MAFLSSLDISASALSAQRTRMDIISQNIANQATTKTEDGTPYRRQLVVFQEDKSFKKYLTDSKKKVELSGVKISAVVKDQSPLKPVYEPDNPDADENGYIYMPNVDNSKEQIDMLAATNSYSANITALNATKSMARQAIGIMSK